jgi:hypothetical protein
LILRARSSGAGKNGGARLVDGVEEEHPAQHCRVESHRTRPPINPRQSLPLKSTSFSPRLMLAPGPVLSGKPGSRSSGVAALGPVTDPESRNPRSGPTTALRPTLRSCASANPAIQCTLVVRCLRWPLCSMVSGNPILSQVRIERSARHNEELAPQQGWEFSRRTGPRPLPDPHQPSGWKAVPAYERVLLIRFAIEPVCRPRLCLIYERTCSISTARTSRFNFLPEIPP